MEYDADPETPEVTVLTLVEPKGGVPAVTVTRSHGAVAVGLAGGNKVRFTHDAGRDWKLSP